MVMLFNQRKVSAVFDKAASNDKATAAMQSPHVYRLAVLAARRLKHTFKRP